MLKPNAAQARTVRQAPETLMLLEDQIGNIEALREAIGGCTLRCTGIVCDAPKGRPPRGLLLEGSDLDSQGTIVVGLNPGHASTSEVATLRGQPKPHEAWGAYWENHLRLANQYYIGVGELLRQCGRVGPILWTNLAKCESPPNVRGGVPLQTLSTCMERYFQYEVWTVPRSWPFLALGREVRTAVTFRFPERIIAGVPHPSGSKPNFRRLFDPDGVLRASVRNTLTTVFASEQPTTSWVASPGDSGTIADAV